MSDLKDKRKIFDLHNIIQKLNEEAMDLLNENDILRQEVERLTDQPKTPEKKGKASRLTESIVELGK